MKAGDLWRIPKNLAVLEVMEITDSEWTPVKCKVVDVGRRDRGSAWGLNNIHHLRVDWFKDYGAELITKSNNFTSLYQKLL